MVNVHRFLYTVLLALVQYKKDSKAIISFDPGKGKLYLSGKELPFAGEGHSEARLGNRIQFIAGEFDIRKSPVHPIGIIHYEYFSGASI